MSVGTTTKNQAIIKPSHLTESSNRAGCDTSSSDVFSTELIMYAAPVDKERNNK